MTKAIYFVIISYYNFELSHFSSLRRETVETKGSAIVKKRKKESVLCRKQKRVESMNLRNKAAQGGCLKGKN